jgi:hypothetical protein
MILSKDIVKKTKKPVPEKIYFITISGLDYIVFPRDQTWKDRLYSLFIEAKLPTFYIKHIYTPEYYIRYPNTVFIYVINSYAKKFAVKKLRKCIKQNYHRKINIF